MSERHRHHIKSHHGCLQCKKRRVKCDETRPSCQKCNRRKSVCSFIEDPAPWIFVDGADSRAALQRNSSPNHNSAQERPDNSTIAYSDGRSSFPSSVQGDPCSPPQQSPLADSGSPSVLGDGSFLPSEEQASTGQATQPNVGHLRLMWYFTEHAWRSMATQSHWTTDSDMQKTWKEITPNLAFDHPVLLHSTLAISALHWILACDRVQKEVSSALPAPPSLPMSRRRMLYLSYQHHSLALALFRELLQQPMTTENRVPLFLTAVFVAMHGFSSALTAPSNPTTASSPDHDPIKVLLKLFTLLQGTGPIISPIGESILNTPLRVLMPPSPKDATLPLGQELEELFQSLGRHHTEILASSAFTDNSTKEDYTQALSLLRQTYILNREEPDRQTIVLAFAIFLPSRILADIAAGHSLALCIAAAYAVILHQLRHHIWVQGQGRAIVQAIAPRVFGDTASGIVRRCQRLIENAG